MQELESDPHMRKGVLMDRILHDPSIQWDHIFLSLNLRGRHRSKQRCPAGASHRHRCPRCRWRRAVIVDAIRRPFLRGGARKRVALPIEPAVPHDVPNPSLPQRLLKVAPWFIDVQELHAFSPHEVWARFRASFPVLAVYRAGWVASASVAAVPEDLNLDAWSAVFQNWRAPVDAIGGQAAAPRCNSVITRPFNGPKRSWIWLKYWYHSRAGCVQGFTTR